NLLIYLDRELQQQAINIFSYALLPSRFLFLGSSETADHPANLFRTIDRQCRIYQSAGRKGDFSVLPRLFVSERIGEPRSPQPRQGTGPPNGWGDMAVHRSALEKFAPPSILVDQDYNAVHLTENAGRFLQPSGGPLRTDVIELMRPELRVYLRAALNRAFEHASSTFTPPVPVHFN